MIDFMEISTRSTKRGVIEIYPKFLIKQSSDLMIRGGDFYAVWIEERGLWSTDEQDALQIIDRELDRYAEENRHKYEDNVKVLHMWDAETGMIDKWHKYCQKQLRDNFHILDERLIFSNYETSKKDYASKKLSYPLGEGDTKAYDHLMSTLYSEEERHKIEWAIGAVITGDSVKIQKFLVLYGAPSTGKSTVINIIEKLFDGYWTAFDAKVLGSSNNSFALEAFKSNPLVAIQHDGDLSRIEDNTRLNSLVAHEMMTVNEKFKSTYSTRFKCFLFMATNKPVKITDAKSGLIRRLIDVSPTGKRLGLKDYKTTMNQVDFELGAIAYHCKEVYLADPGIYDNYIPIAMLGASNDFYNFVIDSYHIFKRDDGVTLKAAWEMYKTYCDEAKAFQMPQRIFKEELKNYFYDFKERFDLENGERVRSYYIGFRTDKFNSNHIDISEESKKIVFKKQKSVFDEACADYPAQYATLDEIPERKWKDVTTTLSDLDTSRLHYIKVPTNHIVIDFDIPDENGNKCFKRNLEEASKWPETYAELSKSGQGIHLHYIYNGDVSELARVYAEDIEIKVFTGNSSLRRRLTKCNNSPINTISSGLPKVEKKKGDSMINNKSVKSEKNLRAMIERNLRKEIHADTRSSIDFIFKILTDAYNEGLTYDVRDMKNSVLAFAMNSTHQSDYCIKLVGKMPFKSEDHSEWVSNEDVPIIFYDVEVFPNLFLVCWKFAGEENPPIAMYNPTAKEIEELLPYRLIDFNGRRYDRHILYARLIGYSNEQIYKLSRSIISEGKGFFSEAYNIGYTDVYDFASSGNKKSLKKLEIEMGIHHQELGLPWDQPVDEALWEQVADYCKNDVIATEAAFHYLKADWTAREILSGLPNGSCSVNDTTNQLTTKLIFDKNRSPQDEFYYRDLSQKVTDYSEIPMRFLRESAPEMVKYWSHTDSQLPYFEDYIYENGVSTYRGEKVGEGGYVYAEPGIYTNVALLDVSSMHPTSIISEMLFGPRYTTTFRELVQARIDIKHEDWDALRRVLGGKLAPYISRVENGELSSKDLANALKTAINSVYGLTAAKFNNPFKDPRNIDNIVAKRGALFMIDLKHAVQEQGYIVAHIKTDSIKIPNATPEIIQFVMDFGKRYGYSFEHEDTYERMCLVNQAVYIARHADGKWTATGDQFKVPYVFKTLFSHEPIIFDDMCETFSVTSGDLYLDFNESLPDVSAEEKELKKLDPEKETKRIEELKKIIETGHSYKYVGRVGRFTPVMPGCGGGVLYRVKDGKYYAATGTTGYRWMESETMSGEVDTLYYERLVEDAVKTINKFGSFDLFVSDEPYPEELGANDGDIDCPNVCNEDGVPFDCLEKKCNRVEEFMNPPE